MSTDTRRFAVAFTLLWLGFVGEFLWVHVRLAPPAGAVLRHAELDLLLEPDAGRARVQARLDIEAPPGSAPRQVALVLPAAARSVRVADASGRLLGWRWRSHRHLFLSGRPGPAGREWRLQRYAEPRLDVFLRGGEPTLRVEYEIEASELRGHASLRPERTLLPGGWSPRLESDGVSAPPAFTYRLQARAPSPLTVVASGRLLRREPEGGIERSEWSSAWPGADLWVAAAPLRAHESAHHGRRVWVYVPREREAPLAAQIAADALQAHEAIAAWAGEPPGSEWHLATLPSLGAVARSQPPLVLLDDSIYRRAARRPGSRAERRGWLAQEMGLAWTRVPPPSRDPQAARVLGDALGAVLAHIALAGPPAPAQTPPRPHPQDVIRARVEWMMRCRAHAGGSALLPSVAADGSPAAGILGLAKLPATLDTLASQIGEAGFLALLTHESPDPLLRRLRRTRREARLAALLTQPWLPDLSLERVDSDASGVRVLLRDRGQGPETLRVAVRLTARDGGERLQWADLPPGGDVEVRFEGARAWRRIDADPDKRIFQVELGNDTLPASANPWAARQALWDARGFIGRGEFARAVEAGRQASALDPHLGEAAYWAGFALLKMERGPEAVEWLERALSAPQESDVVAAETLYQLGQACQAAGDRRRARRLYEQVIEEGWTSLSVERARRALETLEGSEAAAGGRTGARAAQPAARSLRSTEG